MGPLVVVLAILAIFFFIFAASAIRIVQPYQRGVKERLGKYHETLDPGLRMIVPFVDKIRMVDMREQVVDVPPQEVITSDNVVVSVDAVIYYEPTDPNRLVYNVANFILAVTKLAQTNLRNVVGDLQLDQALTSRDKINVDLRQILDDATDKWGVRVVRVEIQRIDPPPDVMHAMHEQMKAERTRRAVVTEADGRREAAITTAEGDKQAAILRAEGERQRQILQAQGDAEATRALADAERFRQLTVAEGEARAITTVYQAIHAGDPSPDLLAIKYLETLGRIANGQATKIYLPADFASGLGSLATVAELFAGSGTDEEGRETRASQARAALDRQVEETASRRIAPTAGRSSATTEAAIPAQAPVVAPAPLPQPPAAPPPPPPV
ncbi:MAG TPA: SPFH domain-containing protein [Acidimicrobiales bacterium]|nr:SPFH/Band 7/PHB domain protein [Acidimicrobiales bacterium]HMS88571.1 SPFH domain-containing protein [Acidimicrobiales bacterium]HRA35541.1 SPFH domain-containing protein [Acidimicrobiales bacterium]